MNLLGLRSNTGESLLLTGEADLLTLLYLVAN